MLRLRGRSTRKTVIHVLLKLRLPPPPHACASLARWRGFGGSALFCDQLLFLRASCCVWRGVDGVGERFFADLDAPQLETVKCDLEQLTQPDRWCDGCRLRLDDDGVENAIAHSCT